MEIIKNILLRNWLGLAIALVILYFLMQSCNENARLSGNIVVANTQITSYQNALGTTTSQIKTLELTNSELKNKMTDTIAKLTKKFASVKAITTIKTITKFDSIKVPFEIPIHCNFVREDSVLHDWYSFHYRVDSLGIELSNLQIPNEQIIVTGFQRKWFLGKQTVVTEVTNTNPNIKVTGLKSTEVIVPKRWYESKLLWFLAGALTFKAITP
jgi:hypothetical protein